MPLSREEKMECIPELPSGDPRSGLATGLGAETSAAWTPGPWVVKDGYVGSDVPAAAPGDIICDAPPTRFRRSSERWPANARLISAAPDMYEALRAARDAVEGHFDDNCDVCREAIDMIRAALAKAEGQS